MPSPELVAVAAGPASAPDAAPRPAGLPPAEQGTRALVVREEEGSSCAIGEEKRRGDTAGPFGLPTRWRDAKKPSCREKVCRRIVPSPGTGAGRRRAVGVGRQSDRSVGHTD
jgi:hypothetical protein